MSDPKLFYRTFQIERSRIDVEKREVELAFSSETPVQISRDVFEILDHANMNMERLKRNAPLLKDHDHTKQIGVILSARIDSDKVGRCWVRFSKGAQGQETFTDVDDGICTNVSVGYTRDRVISKEAVGDAEYIRYAFTPHEVSIVAMPADVTVGVGRGIHSLPTDKNERGNMPDTTIEIAELKTQKKNSREIIAMAEAYKHKVSLADAQRFINEGKTPDEFREFILRQYRAVPTGQIDPDIGMSEREIKSYSLVRAINSFAENKRFDGLELEASKAAEKKYGRAAQSNGLIVPWDVLTHKRALNATALTAGGYTIGTDILAGNFVDLLRAKALVATLGANMLNGLIGDVVIPTLGSDPVGYWLSETEEIPDSQSTFGQVLMTPHRLGSSVPISKQLLIQSSLDIEGLVRRLLATVLAQGFDLAAIAGSGVDGQPLGIVNTTGVLTVTYGAAATWAKVVESETTLAGSNADQGQLAWLTSPAVRGKWKTIPKVTAQPVYLWDAETNRANGYPAFATNQVANGKTIFGNWADVNIGTWGSGLDMIVDPFTLAKSNQVQVTVNMHGDISLNRPTSFVVSTDSGAQ